MDIEAVVYDASYDDIMMLSDDIREPFLLKFIELTQQIPLEIYSKKKKVIEMIYEQEQLEESLISQYVFPGEKVHYYPNIRFRRSSKEFICAVSGVRFKKGKECIVFKPFFYLPTKRESYILDKPIKADCYFHDFFPKTLQDYDYFLSRLEHSYISGDEEYSNFYSNIKENTMLRKLKHK